MNRKGMRKTFLKEATIDLRLVERPSNWLIGEKYSRELLRCESKESG